MKMGSEKANFSVPKYQRIYVGDRTKNNYFVKVRKWNRKCSLGNIEHCLSSLNSYVGTLKRRNAYGILRKGYESLSDKWHNYIELTNTNTLKAKEGYRHNELLKLKFSLYGKRTFTKRSVATDRTQRGD